MKKENSLGNNARIQSLTDPECPLRGSTPGVKNDGIDLLELLISGQATVSDVEGFEDTNLRYSQKRRGTNLSKCASRILAGECSTYGVQEVVLPDYFTEDADVEEYEGLSLLKLLDDAELAEEIKAGLAVGPRIDIEEMGPKIIREEDILG